MQPFGRYGFGGFTFDTRTRSLSHHGRPIDLTDREAALVAQLVTRAGRVIPKEELIPAIWGDVAVTDNSLEQLLSSVRRLLRNIEDAHYVETLPRRGYRFAAEVRPLPILTSDDEVMALIAPHRAWLEGRAALETFDAGQVAGARAAFEQVLADVPEQASAHLGLANACVMQFEMTRTDVQPNVAALDLAAVHAREACRLEPALGESWATLGFVLSRTGRRLDAIAAGRRAIALEPGNWRHHFRLSSIGWGEERLQAARRTLALLPGFPLAHFLAATVHVARGAFDEATRELRAGIASAEMRGADEPRFSGVALHWLLGLVLAESDDLAGALTALEHECALEGSRHLYGREGVANSWYAIGALRLRSGDRAGAGAAFGEAERRMPRHPGAAIGLVLLDGRGLEDLARRGAESEHLSATDRAMGLACVCGASALAGRPLPPGVGMELAAAAVDAALSAAEPGNAGWLLPVEPLIHPSGAPDVWSAALSRLRGRAA